MRKLAVLSVIFFQLSSLTALELWVNQRLFAVWTEDTLEPFMSSASPPAIPLEALLPGYGGRAQLEGNEMHDVDSDQMGDWMILLGSEGWEAKSPEHSLDHLQRIQWDSSTAPGQIRLRHDQENAFLAQEMVWFSSLRLEEIILEEMQPLYPKASPQIPQGPERNHIPELWLLHERHFLPMLSEHPNQIDRFFVIQENITPILSMTSSTALAIVTQEFSLQELKDQNQFHEVVIQALRSPPPEDTYLSQRVYAVLPKSLSDMNHQAQRAARELKWIASLSPEWPSSEDSLSTTVLSVPAVPTSQRFMEAWERIEPLVSFGTLTAQEAAERIRQYTFRSHG
ncbi:MAG: hypothetical protein MI717_11790 [Spirochaetales bacterium]|nr:hypothetical protein [Spirochaetales bacterium]